MLLINKKDEPNALTLHLVLIFALLVQKVEETIHHNNTFAIRILGKFGRNSMEIQTLMILKNTKTSVVTVRAHYSLL